MKTIPIEVAVSLVLSVGLCRLTKLEGGTAMRSTVIEGEAVMFPRLGASYFMRSKPLEDPNAMYRIINTSGLSDVALLPDNQGMVLETCSGSRYLLESIRG